ncbi:MAG: PDZ domain-containing protein, partial [Anaerotignum sp.]|nr:PDZ domain-containing protein [Anaerotignum sp.]
AVCPKWLFLILAFCLFLPPPAVYGAEMLVPVGKTVGVTMDTRGLLVLGTGNVDGENNCTYTPCKGILQAGDLLLEADGKTLENKEMFMETVEKSEGEPVSLQLQRDGRKKEVSVKPVFSVADGTYKIGAWIRDSIQGIGTVTYYDPAEQTFGALGHGVYDVDTGKLMEIREGSLTAVELTEIVKGQKGKVGELTGKIDLQEKFAHIRENTEAGIFGSTDTTVFDGKALPVASMKEIKKGAAVMLSDLEGDGVKAYAIEIESIRKNGGKDHKDMTIRITDERLLKLAGGIVQGTSGSPILQDGKFVGAVTHVMLHQPEKGYGICMENMRYPES